MDHSDDLLVCEECYPNCARMLVCLMHFACTCNLAISLRFLLCCNSLLVRGMEISSDAYQYQLQI